MDTVVIVWSGLWEGRLRSTSSAFVFCVCVMASLAKGCTPGTAVKKIQERLFERDKSCRDPVSLGSLFAFLFAGAVVRERRSGAVIEEEPDRLTRFAQQ
jgi:hypothetical protein